MALRTCIYKSCENYINLNNRSINNVILFSFPKNPERRQKWLELGKVSANHPSSRYYFCSDHFDKKYLAVNNRRTVLVGEALPFPYTEIEESCEDTDGNIDFFLYEMNRENDLNEKQFKLDDKNLHVESTTLTNELQEIVHGEQLSEDFNEQEFQNCIIYTEEEKDTSLSATTYKKKRPLNNTITQTQSAVSKAKILKISPQQIPLHKALEKTNNIKSSKQIQFVESSSSLCVTYHSEVSSRETNEDEIVPDQLVDSKHVTTFIFKGEEYVQMPKDYYVNEKMELMKKLQKMEKTVKAIKEHLNSL